MTVQSIGRFRAAALAGVIVSLSFVMLADRALSQTVESFKDDFSGVSYSGNNGSMNWSGSWQESGESDGPASGSVRVAGSDRCFGGSGNCLRIGSEGGSLDNYAASRTADLGNAVSATMSFHYRRQTQGQVSGSIAVQVSGNGGASWTTLTTIDLAGPQKASTETFDVSGYMGIKTVVRFRGSGSGVTGYMYFDAIEVTADMIPPSTTTTVAPTTTTVPGSPTTTTTVPGSPTTTTIPGSPTTTTIPGSPTTTTIPGSQTTSTVPPSSTTATSVTSSSGTTPSTTSPTASDTSTSDSLDEPTVSASDVSGQPEDGPPVDDDLAPMSIAVEAAVDNAASAVVLAVLASGLAFAGIDRTRRRSAQVADPGVESTHDDSPHRDE